MCAKIMINFRHCSRIISNLNYMKKGILLSAMLLAFLMGSCQNQSDSSNQEVGQYELLSVNDFSSKIQKEENLQLLDVRTPREWQGGVLEGALQINMYDADFYDKVSSKVDKSKPVYVYCQGGVRSKEVGMQLIKMGYSNVYDLKGGYASWVSIKK